MNNKKISEESEESIVKKVERKVERAEKNTQKRCIKIDGIQPGMTYRECSVCSWSGMIHKSHDKCLKCGNNFL